MSIEILLEKEVIAIKLKNASKIIDSVELKNEKNISKTLLIAIDNLLRKNKLGKNQLKNISVKNKIPESYTSSRIAKSLAKSFNFSQKIV